LDLAKKGLARKVSRGRGTFSRTRGPEGRIQGRASKSGGRDFRTVASKKIQGLVEKPKQRGSQKRTVKKLPNRG